MSNLELFADDIDGYLITAVTDNGKLIDLYVSKPQVNGSWASTYLGKVTKIDTKLNAAFLDLGDGLTGFLPANYAEYKDPNIESPKKPISQILDTGETLLVQVKTEGKANSPYENHKLARLTARLHVPGGFIVYKPQAETISCLSNIDEKTEKEINATIDKESGWSSYPYKSKMSKEEINFEIEYLQRYWQEILNKKEQLGSNAGLIEIGPIALFRAFMDYGVTSFANIHVGNKLIFKIVEDWANKHLPQLATSKRLRLFKASKPNERLFDIYDLYGELENLKYPIVELENGGNLIIEHTSALTTIDVNQGGSGEVEETNFKAAEEVARQIKLRNLSGIILIDFIGNIPKKQERIRLIKALEKHLEHDVGSSQVHGFTRLGIVEITRRRKTAPLHEKIK